MRICDWFLLALERTLEHGVVSYGSNCCPPEGEAEAGKLHPLGLIGS